ncbi:MAG: hypothetical protein Q7R95_05980 [bacterium]|nr:hypothetical protein [bacterium]
MKLSTKFNIDDKIYIKDLKIWGKILSISISGPNRIQYNVRFFNNTDPKEIYFLEDELSLQEEENRVGFKE